MLQRSATGGAIRGFSVIGIGVPDSFSLGKLAMTVIALTLLRCKIYFSPLLYLLDAVLRNAPPTKKKALSSLSVDEE